MKKALVGFAIGVSLFLYPRHARMVDRVGNSVVRITGIGFEHGEGYTCSGFVVAPNRVLTAQHCLAEKMWVDEKEAVVLREDEYYDLAMLAVETSKPALTFSDATPEQFDEVTAFGYGHGWDRLTVLDMKVLAVNFTPNYEDTPPGLWTQTANIGGMSGGPVTDTSGAVLGIVQRTLADRSSGQGYGAGTATIRVFMLGIN